MGGPGSGPGEPGGERAMPHAVRGAGTLLLLGRTTAVLAGVTALGLAAVGGSFALLNAQERLPGTVVSAGTAELRIEGEESARLPSFAVTPSSPVARAFTVANRGTVELALTAEVLPTSAPELLGSVRARLLPVDDRAACAPGLVGAQASPLDGFRAEGLPAVPPGGERILCLELSVAAGTSAALSGQRVPFELVVTGVQRGE